MKAQAQSAGNVSPPLSASSQVSVTRLLLNVSLARIFLSVSGILNPVQTLFSGQLLFGRSVWQILKDCQRYILFVLGYLSAPATHPWLRGVSHLTITTVKRWHVLAAACIALGVTRSMRRRLAYASDEGERLRARLALRMSEAKSYFEWSVLATKLDAARGVDAAARSALEGRLYDRRLLREKVAHLRKVRALGTLGEQMFALRADLLRDLGGMTAPALHDHFPVCPAPIREYLEEVKGQLEDIAACADLPLAERSTFLRETRHAFGRTALVLTGSGDVAGFHLGVVRALLEHYMLPRVLAGSGVGAIVCGLVATRNDAQLSRLLSNLDDMDPSLFATAAGCGDGAGAMLRLALTGGCYAVRGGGGGGEGCSDPASTSAPAPAAVSEALLRLRHALGDLTFMQAFHATGRVLNLAVAGGGARAPPRLLNYLTAPHVYVWSAVAAAAGPHGGVGLAARGADGAPICYDLGGGGSGGGGGAPPRALRPASLPLQSISEMFSANHFIVSQASPLVVPLLRAAQAAGGPGAALCAELKYRARLALDVAPGLGDRLPLLQALAADWTGDVTIAPADALLHTRSMLVGAARGGRGGAAALHAAARAGELAAWSKLSAVQCNCGIEATLDACIHQVATWERGAAREARERARAGFALSPAASLAAVGSPRSRSSSQAVLLVEVPEGREGEEEEECLAGGDDPAEHEPGTTPRRGASPTRSDEMYDASEDCLPLPEERGASATAAHRAAWPSPSACTDDSANVLQGLTPLPRGAFASSLGLDVVAP